MNYTIKFLPNVENDALNAYFWYEKKSKGLGEEFLKAKMDIFRFSSEGA